MHKLVILIQPLEDWGAFDESWPEFLRFVEAMPGLRREVSSHIEGTLFGSPYALMHELFFDNLGAAQQALASPSGRSAGRLLQSMTQGKMSLFFADHKEDDLEHIRSFTEEDNSPGNPSV